MISGALKVRIPNPRMGSGIDDSPVREILRQTGITVREWDEA